MRDFPVIHFSYRAAAAHFCFRRLLPLLLAVRLLGYQSERHIGVR